MPLAWSGDVTQLARALSMEPAWCWLDGAGDDAGGNWSYLGVASEVISAEPGAEAEFLDLLRAGGTDRGDSPVDPSESDRVPGDFSGGFSGGWVTALGYEFGVALMGLSPSTDSADPAFALRLDVVLAVDHTSGRAELRGRSEAAVEAVRLRVEALLRAGKSEALGAPAATSEPAPPRWRHEAHQYEAAVESCRQAIRRGEAYVLCLTDTAEVRGGSVDPLDLYLRLRDQGFALRGGVIVAGDRALVSVSPERFLSLRGNQLSTHPIKGTRPRYANDAEDRRAAEELENDPKERAENLMIVDLMRNDLSRVCAAGTVAVTGFLRVETHPHVHQLVSTVSGDLKPGNDVFDAITACFPGGSMTGAPKRRAVELLAELEGEPRGLYSGCFGWLDTRGDAELAMSIRSIELRSAGHPGAAGDRAGGTVALVGAGGGVTIDSDPAREHDEKGLKAAPLLTALMGATLE